MSTRAITRIEMHPNEQVVEADSQATLETELLRILAQPDVVIPDDEIATDGSLTDEQRATLQRVLESEMPTIEEIEQANKIDAHNAVIQKRRDEKLARRRERNAKNPKRRRRR